MNFLTVSMVTFFHLFLIASFMTCKTCKRKLPAFVYQILQDISNAVI